jgi:hypothetical protein
VSDETVVVPLTAEQEAAQEQTVAREIFAVRGLVAVDQAANVLTGGLPDETISSRLARDAARHDKRAKLAAAAEENSGNLPGK